MVVTVFTAVLILLGQPTKETWKVSANMLKSPSNFFKLLVNFDKDNVPKKTLIKVKKITDEESFTV